MYFQSKLHICPLQTDTMKVAVFIIIICSTANFTCIAFIENRKQNVILYQHLFTACFENKFYSKGTSVKSTCSELEIHFDLGLRISCIAALVYDLES